MTSLIEIYRRSPDRGAAVAVEKQRALKLIRSGEITVRFGGNSIVDEEGPDFIVFENVFYVILYMENLNILPLVTYFFL